VTSTDTTGPAFSTGPTSTAMLAVKDLRVHFPTDDGIVKAVDGLSFTLERGRTLGIVGESGSGKSVASLAIMGLHRGGDAAIGGEIWLDGENLVSASHERVRQLRGSKMAMIFQDPLSSLHPFYTVGAQIAGRSSCTTELPRRRRAAAPSQCSIAWAYRTRPPGSMITRTSSPAGCDSGS